MAGLFSNLLRSKPPAPRAQSPASPETSRADAWHHRLRQLRERYFGPGYRTPNELTVTPTPLKRVLVIGSCLVEGWPELIRSAQPGCEADYVLFNNLAELPTAPPQPVSAYDFQLVQIPLRSVLPDYAYFRLPYEDAAGHQRLVEECRDRLCQFLDGALRWNREAGLLTFATSFMLPQQNPMGRLLPRFDLRNPIYLIERLNQTLTEELARARNAYVLDLDQLAANFGRRYVQDDAIWQLSHGALISEADYPNDQKRIEPIAPVADHLPLKTAEFLHSVWAELVAMFRTVRQIDAVKIVIVDLDDTLWRGVIGEANHDDLPPTTLEGWPLGLVEALCYLKKRGVLLAIASKNTESTIDKVWDKIFMGRLFPQDFAIRCINWEPKAQNLERIFQETNLLPRNAVFVDDNPVERAAVKAAFPDIRVLGSYPYYLRQVLLWSSETQVAAISTESGRRTEMIHAQMERESQRKRLSREEFLLTLELKTRLIEIESPNHASFPRAFELLNKTNQFNTTGQRWTLEQVARAFQSGERWTAFEANDRFSSYGLIGVVRTNIACLEQFVMSCRVVGLGLENAIIAELAKRLKDSGQTEMSAQFVRTDANHLCTDLYLRAGFAQRDNGWVRNLEQLPDAPVHVEVTFG